MNWELQNKMKQGINHNLNTFGILGYFLILFSMYFFLR